MNTAVSVATRKVVYINLYQLTISVSTNSFKTTLGGSFRSEHMRFMAEHLFATTPGFNLYSASAGSSFYRRSKPIDLGLIIINYVVAVIKTADFKLARVRLWLAERKVVDSVINIRKRLNSALSLGLDRVMIFIVSLLPLRLWPTKHTPAQGSFPKKKCGNQTVGLQD